jgi:fucose permease
MLAGAAVLTVSVGNLERSVAGVLLFGLSCGPIFPTVLALVATAARGNGTATSLALALGNSGGLVVPALLGWLLNRYGPTATAGTLLGAALTMLALYAAAVWVGAMAERGMLQYARRE